MPNGDVYPCRRMPIRAGNVLDRPLAEIYRDAPLLRTLRDHDRVSAGCEGCRHRPECRGGLRCLAYAVTGDPFHADPGCWMAASRLRDNRADQAEDLSERRVVCEAVQR